MPNGVFPVPRFHPNQEAAQPSPSEERSRLANRIVDVLGDARGPNLGAFRARTRARHAAIRENADDLLALVLRLRADQPIEPRATAMTALLVDGPLRRGDGQGLQHAIREALVAAEPATRQPSRPLDPAPSRRRDREAALA